MNAALFESLKVVFWPPVALALLLLFVAPLERWFDYGSKGHACIRYNVWHPNLMRDFGGRFFWPFRVLPLNFSLLILFLLAQLCIVWITTHGAGYLYEMRGLPLGCLLSLAIAAIALVRNSEVRWDTDEIVILGPTLFSGKGWGAFANLAFTGVRIARRSITEVRVVGERIEIDFQEAQLFRTVRRTVLLPNFPDLRFAFEY